LTLTLKAANELRKAGLEVKVFEKSVGVAGVWRANYADFGLQALSYYGRTCYVAIYYSTYDMAVLTTTAVASAYRCRGSFTSSLATRTPMPR
jgi:predicted NAD/FAD-dependent oxidoreductase